MSHDPAASSDRPLDIVVFGATGFTGRLTAEYLARHGGSDLRWGIAGRNAQKLQALADELVAQGAPQAPEQIQASLDDPASLRAMAQRARVVATTVGPYIKYGEPVVEACVAAATDYVDITGEPEFVDQIRKRFGDTARDKGLRLVSCCGFDSIPHDLGAYYAVRHLGADAPIRLEGVVSASGTFSGGTWHSAVEAMGRFRRWGLSGKGKKKRPEHDRVVRPLKQKVRRERRIKGWMVPMPTIDPVIVLRSARDLEEYGPDFRYAHYMRVGSLPAVMALGAGLSTVFTMAQLPPTRKLLLKMRSPGQGPDAETRAKSHFRVTFLGTAGDKKVVAEVRGGDPGYGETSKMLAESALSLALDRDRLPERYGHLTPASAMGDVLLERLQEAGIVFTVREGG